MKLFHGSNVAVQAPVLFKTDRRVDFGPGFYVTSSLEQASRWARTVTFRRGEGHPTVTVYDFDNSSAEDLDILTFSGPNLDWLRFIGANRRGTSVSQHDIVIGPVANDNTMPTLRLFFSGIYSEEETIKRLLPQKLKDQYAFKSQPALKALTFCEVIHL